MLLTLLTQVSPYLCSATSSVASLCLFIILSLPFLALFDLCVRIDSGKYCEAFAAGQGDIEIIDIGDRHVLASIYHDSHVLTEQVLIATWLLIEISQVCLHVLEATLLAEHAMAFFEELLTMHSAVLACCHHILLLKLVLTMSVSASSTIRAVNHIVSNLAYLLY